MIEIAQRNLVTVYAMSTVAFGFHTDSEENLTQLTQSTGGKVEMPLNNIYKDISGYLSTPSDYGNYAIAVGSRATRLRSRGRSFGPSQIWAARSPANT